MDEFLHLLTNPAHWGFEAVSDLVFAVPAYFAGMWRARRLIAAHDQEVHDSDPHDRKESPCDPSQPGT